jgi:NADPH2:quinone reductase
MASAIRIHRTGGPDVLSYEDVALPDPSPGEVRLRQTAIGVNYIDTYHRSGLYPAPGGLPAILGSEGAGVVTAVGGGVAAVRTGDRVAYASVPGAYVSERNIAAEKLVKLPDRIDDQTAAAVMLKGMTAQYLLRQCFRVEPGHTVLIHAAAGGVGLIACQWARELGATVIGTAGSEEKARLAREHGCHHTILYRDEDFVARVAEITNGAKCDVVYDGVGKATFPASLDCIKPRGMFVSFGNASGAVESFNILTLMTKGSLFCTRPTLGHYTSTPQELSAVSNDLFDVMSRGAVKIMVRQSYPLREAAQAHIALQGRETVGSSILLP